MESSKIPKIIHQIWIGPKPAPTKFMNTWKEKNPDFEYILWNEAEFEKRGIVFECQEKIDVMPELCGKADIIRYEVLYKYGGYYFDADSICIEPIDEELMSKLAFAGYENETVRPGLVANGTMAFPVNHPLCREAIDWILKNNISGIPAWMCVGPTLLTNLLNTGQYNDVTIFPSYYFLPLHYTGNRYDGHSKIYQYQEWGSTKQNYETMNQIDLPDWLKSPNNMVSVLVCSYNTKHSYIIDCLKSIKEQQGHFGIELVWINDGSNELSTKLLEKALDNFQKTTRFCNVVYHKNSENKGVCESLYSGLLLCSNEIVIRMDSDDVMYSHRIQTQLDFMKSHSDCVMCGSNIQMIQQNGELGYTTSHPEKLTWEQYEKQPSAWFMNHPTLCFKKSKILSVGNYNIEKKYPFEDLELEVKVLKKYGVIYNIPEVLLLYRLHENQVTYDGKTSTPDIVEMRNQFIQSMIDT